MISKKTTEKWCRKETVCGDQMMESNLPHSFTIICICVFILGHSEKGFFFFFYCDFHQNISKPVCQFLPRVLCFLKSISGSQQSLMVYHDFCSTGTYMRCLLNVFYCFPILTSHICFFQIEFKLHRYVFWASCMLRGL